MTTLASLLPDPESIAAVRAIHDTHGREAAVLLLQEWQDPDGIVESFEWCQGSHEGCRPAIRAGSVDQTQGRVEGYRQGRLV